MPLLLPLGCLKERPVTPLMLNSFAALVVVELAALAALMVWFPLPSIPTSNAACEATAAHHERRAHQRQHAFIDCTTAATN
jgi:hypothetical protein